MAGRKWSDLEIQFIKDNFISMSCTEMAQKLNRTTRAVQHMFGFLNLERPQPQIGDKINRLTIVKIYTKHFHGQNHTVVDCKCDCGNILKCRRMSLLVSKKLKSCKCLKEELAAERCKTLSYKHGKSDLKNNRLYRIWSAMKTRCYNTNTTYYKNYGGRGINICDEWRNCYESFEKWSLENGYQANLTIDRIDCNGNYEPSNCRWATQAQQNNNRTNTRACKVLVTAFGESKTAAEWIKDPRCVLNKPVSLFYRLGSGWEPEKAITQKSQRD